MTTTTPAPQPPKTRPRRPRWLLPVVGLVVAAAAVGVGVGIGIAGHDDTVAMSHESQLTTVQASCEEWMVAPATGKADDAWCSGMVSWMRDNSSTVMGSRMWDGPDQLRDACHRWADEIQDESGNTAPARPPQAVTTWSSGWTDTW